MPAKSSATPSRSRTTVYRSPLRARQAAETRRAVLQAAGDLFAEQGWAATTMAGVAARAQSAVETVYAGFGSKSNLLVAAIDAALAGDDEPVPLAERPQYTSLASGSYRDRLDAAARLITEIHARSVPLLRALQEAAASDPGAAVRLDQYEAARRTEITRGLELVLDRRPPDRLVDAIWAVAGPEVYSKLVEDRGWSPTAYERWLRDTAAAIARS